jgi:hypothetical protein
MAVVADAAHSSGRTSAPECYAATNAKPFIILNYTTMYYIKKYADCWAIHNDDNGKSRPLTEKEVTTVQEEYPTLKDNQVGTVNADQIRSLENKP